MKKLTIGIVVLCVLLVSCFNIQFGNSPKGNWVLVGSIDNIHNEDTTFTYGEIYKPEIDQYYSAMIIKITDNEMIVYADDSGLEYYVDTIYIASFTEDTLYLSEIEYDDSIALAYYFNEENNLVWVVDANTDYTHELHLKKYNGDIPPDSWIYPVEDDEYEPDNSIANATPIRFSRVQSHTITGNDTDYYRFQADEGQAYLIQGLAYFEIEIELSDEEGNSLASDSDNDLYIAGLDDEVETVIAWECEVSGTYYVRLIGEYRYPSGRTGYYQMKIDKCNIDDIEYDDERQLLEKKVFEWSSKFFIKLQTKMK
jgi:hypothetical protein